MQINLIQILLSVMLYLSMIRGTSVGLFYPSDENDPVPIVHLMLMNYLLLLLMAGFLFLRNDYRFVLETCRKPLYVFMVVGSILSTAFSIDPFESIKFLLVLAAISFPGLIYAKIYGVGELLRQLAVFTVIFTFINLLYILIFPAHGIMSGDHAGRWKGLFDHKNGFGPFFAIAFYLVLNQLKDFKWQGQIIMALTLLICFLFVGMSGSATAVVIFAAMGLSYVVFNAGFRMHPRERAFLFLAAGSLGILVFTFLGAYIGQIFFDVTGRDATLTGRTDIWYGLFQVVLDRPILGYGPGMSARSDFIEQFRGIMGKMASSAHNSYLDLLINFGVIIAPVIIFVIFRYFFVGIFSEFKYKRELQYSVLAASLVLSGFALGFANSGVLLNRTSFWIFTMIGLMILAEKAGGKHLSVRGARQDQIALLPEIVNHQRPDKSGSNQNRQEEKESCAVP